jgi:hypothetical protein
VFLTATAMPARAQFINEGQEKQVSDQIDQLEDSGIEVKNMFFFQEWGLNKAASDRLRMYRVMTREEWNKLTPEQRTEKMTELKKENPNVYVVFPAGNIYSIPNEKFITFLYKISDWPEDFLDYDEERDFYKERDARLRPPQPPKEEKPQSRSNGQAADDHD